MRSNLTPEQEQELISDISSFEYDPEGFVMYAYPWGEPGTELAGDSGPRKWQREFLSRVGRELRAKRTTIHRIVKEAVASGHGIGKSALVAWLIDWAMSTKEDTRGIITAGTEPQMKTKTWPEIRKWFRLSINAHWWIVEETSILSAQPGHKEWRFDRVTWNKAQPEAFAGLHNKGKRLVVIFDEASQIDDLIWEVTDGALTDEDTDIIFAVFGNPTRNTGAFKRCFTLERNLWSGGAPDQIDSREVEGTNKQYLNDLVNEYGENSDRVRVRVRGLFPNASTLQFIPGDIVLSAQKREAVFTEFDPLIMTLDVARGGDDSCVFRFRRGMDARSIKPVRVPGDEAKRDSKRLVTVASELIRLHRPDAFFVDGTGVGGYLINWLRALGIQVLEVQFGEASPDPRYSNFRAYMWAKLKNALELGLAIDTSPILEADLISVEYDHNDRDQLRLEKKEHMKARGVPSPDEGDALAMSYAYHVPTKDKLSSRSMNPIVRARARAASTDFDPNENRESDFDPLEI